MIRWILQTGSKKKSWATNQQETKPSKKTCLVLKEAVFLRIENTFFSWDVREARFWILDGRSRREQEDERKKTTSGARPTTLGAVSRYPQSAAVVWVVFLREHRLRGRWGLKSRVYVYLDLGEGRQARRGILRENFILKTKNWENAYTDWVSTYIQYQHTYNLQYYIPWAQALKSYRILKPHMRTPIQPLHPATLHIFALHTYNLPTTPTTLLPLHTYKLPTTPTTLQPTYNHYSLHPTYLHLHAYTMPPTGWFIVWELDWLCRFV